MRGARHAALAVLVALAAAASGACSAAEDGEDPGSAEDAQRESEFYGKDRVRAKLLGHPERIPASLEGFETLFGMGRSCARRDSKEIFVVEESQTRLAGPQERHDVTATKLMPRAVITGCNTGDLSDPATSKTSYSLMAALISDEGMRESPRGDTMRTWPLEVMALDDDTGLYNFYVFEPATTPADPWAPLPANTPGRVTRVFRAKEARPGRDGQGTFKVFEARHKKGTSPTDPVQPTGGGKRCFNCHVNGGPLMNELRDPWTNWVSIQKTLPKAALYGTTSTLVSEAVVNTTTGRSSLANDLEPIMRTAAQAYVYGSNRGNGWARLTLDGKLPGGGAKVVESLFCETELNYVSAAQSLPLESFVDPDAAGPASLVAPPSFGSDLVPFLFPVRSVRDKETEGWLVSKGYLDYATVMAIRLLDDENDIFSPARCGYLSEVAQGIGDDPSKFGEKIRAVLTPKLAGLPWKATQPKRFAYLTALLTPGVRREVAQREYLTELTARFEAMPRTDQAVKAKERYRKARAREKFSGASNPLPVLDPR